jgi:hypothetical protein
MNYRNAATQGIPWDELNKDRTSLFPEDRMKPVPVKGEKSQGALHRSERATIVLAAKQSWGKRMTAKDKQEIEKLAEEIVDKMREKSNMQKVERTGKPETKEEILQKLVKAKGLGKLARKGILRNGQQRKLRASQLVLAIEGANQNTEEK